MASISFSNGQTTKKPATVEFLTYPAGGNYVVVRWGNLHLHLSPEEARRLSLDLADALDDDPDMDF